jgi:hypothetical protein
VRRNLPLAIGLLAQVQVPAPQLLVIVIASEPSASLR